MVHDVDDTVRHLHRNEIKEVKEEVRLGWSLEYIKHNFVQANVTTTQDPSSELDR